MAKVKQAVNPFYVILVLAGIVFFVTAFAYGVMAFRADRLGRASELVGASSGLMGFLDQYGGQVLGGELLVLGITTVAAMASDGYWSRRQAARQTQADQKAIHEDVKL